MREIISKLIRRKRPGQDKGLASQTSVVEQIRLLEQGQIPGEVYSYTGAIWRDHHIPFILRARKRTKAEISSEYRKYQASFARLDSTGSRSFHNAPVLWLRSLVIKMAGAFVRMLMRG